MSRVYVNNYPEVQFDKTKIFPLSLFPFPSTFEINGLTDEQIVQKYQEHNLVHTLCPRKKCQRYGIKLFLCCKKGSTGHLKCLVCSNTFPSKPNVFLKLSGDHKFLYSHLYSFCLGHNQIQSMNFLSTEKQNGNKVRLFR